MRCHFAELIGKRIADEAPHLAAASNSVGSEVSLGQYGQWLIKMGGIWPGTFYESVFSDNAQGVRYHERTAEALRDATKNLRRKSGMTLERWVNFVHYGA